MKETKVYIDELPEGCFECPCSHEDFAECKWCQAFSHGLLTYIPDTTYTKERLEDCPLKSLHEYKKELVAKVLKEVEDSFTAYLPLKNRTGAWFYGRLNEILKKYQKEFEDE